MFFLRELPPPGAAAGEGSAAAAEEEEQRAEGRYFVVFNGVAVVIAVYLLAFDLSGRHGIVVSRSFAVGLLVLMATPLAVPLYLILQKSADKSRLRAQTHHGEVGGGDVDEEAAVLTLPLLAGDRAGDDHEEGGKQKQEKKGEEEEDEVKAAAAAQRREGRRRKGAIGEDHTIREAVASVDFWVLFFSFLCGVGTGLAVMNNMGQMGLAMGYADVSIFVSLTSIWGFFGRIASGSISEYYLRKAGTPRPLWNAASQILMAVGYVVMAMALPGSLYVGSIVVGICYGVRVAVTVPTASELFGLKYYGLIYNILILNLPLGSFLFSGLLAGLLYDAQATRTAGGGNTCFGPHCYRLVFVIMAVACLVGFGLDVLLAFRTRNLYAKIRSSNRKSRKPASSSRNKS